MSQSSEAPGVQGKLFDGLPGSGLPEILPGPTLPEPAQPAIQEIIAPAVDVRVRAGYLVAALTELATASQANGFQIAGQTFKRAKLEAAYGPLHPTTGVGMGDEMSFKGRQAVLGARSNFKTAYELGTGPVEDDDPGLIIGFGQFYDRFAGGANRKARDQRRKNLRKLASIPGESHGGDRYMAAPEPVIDAAVSAEPHESHGGQEISPTTPERLRALLGDPRAGFLPATSREQNQALTLLDYLDSPQHPAGVGDQLQEVFLHQVHGHDGDIASGQRALLSLGYEFGDYFEQAAIQALSLRALNELVQACPNPHISLLEAVGGTHAGFAPLVRYLDVARFERTGERLGGRETLRTHERREGPQAYEGKNKTVEDAYTASRPPEVIERRIIERVSTVTVGELRQEIRQAAANEDRRAAFWQARLYDTYAHGAAWRAGREVLLHHGLPLRPQRHAA